MGPWMRSPFLHSVSSQATLRPTACDRAAHGCRQPRQTFNAAHIPGLLALRWVLSDPRGHAAARDASSRGLGSWGFGYTRLGAASCCLERAGAAERCSQSLQSLLHKEGKEPMMVLSLESLQCLRGQDNPTLHNTPWSGLLSFRPSSGPPASSWRPPLQHPLFLSRYATSPANRTSSPSMKSIDASLSWRTSGEIMSSTTA